ncbi:hypothetical protein B0J17DRAFT_147609 [Rhizoctonia solani]|nr:hypothetical protein B0J17DRAFT_147609 [Rhizoctonia solani]
MNRLIVLGPLLMLCRCLGKDTSVLHYLCWVSVHMGASLWWHDCWSDYCAFSEMRHWYPGQPESHNRVVLHTDVIISAGTNEQSGKFAYGWNEN